MMRRMVYADATDDAPGEVWLEWSVMEDGSDPVLENDQLANPGRELERKPVRYIRAGEAKPSGPSIHATNSGGLGLEVEGVLIVMPIQDWHKLAMDPPEMQPPEEET